MELYKLIAPLDQPLTDFNLKNLIETSMLEEEKFWQAPSILDT